MKKVKMGLALIVLGFLYLTLSTLGFAASQPQKNNPELIVATLYPKPKEIIPFKLTDNKNKSFTNENLKNHWSLLFFGFTNCGYICPTTLSELKKTYALIEAEQVKPPQVVFISVDPNRDTVIRMDDYITRFSPHFIAATGSDQQLQALTNNLGVLYTQTGMQKGKKDYAVDHSSSILLVNPRGELAAVFSMPHDAAKIARDYITIYQHNRK